MRNQRSEINPLPSEHPINRRYSHVGRLYFGAEHSIHRGFESVLHAKAQLRAQPWVLWSLNSKRRMKEKMRGFKCARTASTDTFDREQMQEQRDRREKLSSGVKEGHQNPGSGDYRFLWYRRPPRSAERLRASPAANSAGFDSHSFSGTQKVLSPWNYWGCHHVYRATGKGLRPTSMLVSVVTAIALSPLISSQVVSLLWFSTRVLLRDWREFNLVQFHE